MFELTWQEFSSRPYIAKLPIHEQTRQFMWEQQRHEMLMKYITSTHGNGVTGTTAGGNSTVEIETLCVNGYVENGYICQYFEL